MIDMAKQPKSKENLGYTFSGILDLTNMTIIESTDEQEFVYDLEHYLGKFSDCEVTLTVKKTTPVESVE